MPDSEKIDIASQLFGLSPLNREYTLERVVRIAALACKAEYAAFSLTIGDQQVYFASCGLQIPSLPIAVTLCHRASNDRETVIIEDVAGAPDPLATKWMRENAGMQAYAGIPVLASNKRVIGTLCVFDDKPRPGFISGHKEILHDCARLIEDLIAMRRDTARDSLTGLFSRQFADDQLEIEWGRAGRAQLPISILKVDIDHFAAINEHAGQVVGDRVIAEVAILISSCFRRAADTISRYSGQQYVAILPSTHFDGGMSTAEKVRETIEAAEISRHGAGNGKFVTVSVGLTTIADQTEIDRYSGNDLLRLADKALSNAKQAGRNCVRSTLLQSSQFLR